MVRVSIILAGHFSGPRGGPSKHTCGGVSGRQHPLYNSAAACRRCDRYLAGRGSMSISVVNGMVMLSLSRSRVTQSCVFSPCPQGFGGANYSSLAQVLSLFMCVYGNMRVLSSCMAAGN